MIKLHNVIKTYKNKLVLDIKEFNFKQGKSYLLVGSNGSGKSTLIKCILNLNKCTSGEIILNSINIGYIPEKIYFPEFLSINSFLNSILSLYNIDIDNNMIDYYCSLFSIDKNLKINNLSKGMKQKVLIIQSLIHDSNLFIFDEPLNGLDSKSQKVFLDIVEMLKVKNNTIIIATHYPLFYGKKFDYNIKIENNGITYENS